jgi:cellulose synthase/poly-beta-1,6-N-acetylglucosamine synthase-like glycosyltransferase
MNILHFFSWILLVVEICIALPIAYLCILSISALITTHKRKRQAHHLVKETAQSNFAILIPAHNEEMILSKLLESLTQLDYPQALYTTYVIADNCTDTTASLAQQFDRVQVYERFNEKERGKGYALNWIWQQLADKQHDAYVVLDADSVVVPTFLSAMDRELAQGALALQACNTVLNITESPSTVLRWIALTLMNHVRPLGRNGIGSTSTLTGNGMCLSRTILTRYPWQAFGIAEDYQYYLTLAQNGERVRYVPEAWHIALQLLKAGLHTKSFVRIEAMLELLTPPLSFMVASCSLAFIASLLLRSPLDIVSSVALLGGLVGYIATALYLLRAPKAVYKALLHAPGFILWKLWVYFVLSRSRKHTGEWVRTARTS